MFREGFWIGPSVTKSHMAEDGNASLPTAFFADHPNRTELPQGQSFFIVGGRKSIVKALIKQADDDTLGAFGEIGSWDEITADERKVFRAVGAAHVATNLPIFTHTGIPGKSALEQLDILEDAGVKPDRVVIGHLGNLVDANVYVHKTLCRRGAFVGFDRQGGNNDAQQVPMVVALVEAGFADHLMFSSDASSGYAKTLTVFAPRLKAAGLSEDILHRILVDNPRRFLAFVPKRSRKK